MHTPKKQRPHVEDQEAPRRRNRWTRPNANAVPAQSSSSSSRPPAGSSEPADPESGRCRVVRMLDFYSEEIVYRWLVLSKELRLKRGGVGSICRAA